MDGNKGLFFLFLFFFFSFLYIMYSLLSTRNRVER